MFFQQKKFNFFIICILKLTNFCYTLNYENFYVISEFEIKINLSPLNQKGRYLFPVVISENDRSNKIFR